MGDIILHVRTVVEELYTALSVPAESYAEVISRIYAQTGETVRYSQVCSAISVVRKAPAELYGWTIPHCKRGRRSPGRLIRVVHPNDGGMDLTPPEVVGVSGGLIGTLGSVSTLTGLSSKILGEIQSQFPTPAMRRLIQSFIRDLDYIGEKAWEMREDCRLAV